MSATSAASSTLTRSRVTVLALASLATIYAGYYVYSTYTYEAESNTLPGPGVHRSNAVHRRRRRNTTSNDDPSSLFVDDQLENDGESNLVARTLTDGETVVDDPDYQWTNLPPSYTRSGQNIVQLLFRVSEDATRRNAYVHRGCLCNSCGTVPIRGIRYRCANCADYDLCENCESQGVHSKAHIFYKIKVPAPSFNSRHIQPVWYTGDPSAVESQLPKHISTKLSRETGFERPELDAYWEQWTYMANTEWRDDPDDIKLAMDRKTFERCLIPSGGHRITAPSLIFDRMFAFYDTNKDDLIGFSEFLHGIAYRKKKDKWKKIFEGYDIDGDGYVDRKDFLRIFRSYYVLYRQMHRDMLEGMEDQQLATSEAHRLVNSRQPLSSAFGQDGRFPRAPDLRAGEGKSRKQDGEEEIIDGKGVMSADGTDTDNRENVFRWTPQVRRNTDQAGFWATLLNPPETVEQLSAVIENAHLRQEVAEIIQSVIGESADHENVRVYAMDGSDPPHRPEVEDANWPPEDLSILEQDVEAIEGPGVLLADVPRGSRRAVIIHAENREKAQRNIYERWQRRQFYTDEEEGGAPPADWKDEDDVLASSAGESSKAPTRHSRSSSKVRFAEDVDDFDTRSNLSTSSRGIHERWGIEIPEVEKDAGKEIMYQVTQQAFNELLDPLFKESEDLAVEFAATTAERDKHRHVWENHEFEEWALERERLEQENPPHQAPSFAIYAERPEEERNGALPPLLEVEVEHVRERSIGDLLAHTGYHVVVENSTSINNSADQENSTTVDGDVADGTASHPSTPSHSDPDSPHRGDPTLPQFRPSSVLSTISLTPSEAHTYAASVPRPGNDFLPLRQSEQEARQPRDIVFTPESAIRPEDTSEDISEALEAEGISDAFESSGSGEAREGKGKGEEDTRGEIDKERAYRLWRCEKAAETAEMRGGAGRLSFVEFEQGVKRCVGEGKGAQMDYLGSWIEFCIP